MTTVPDPAPETPPSDSEVMVCPHCFEGNDPSAHFCRHCVTPLTSHAAIDPVKSITAEMDTISKGAQSPRSFLVLLGMWLLLGPYIVMALFSAFAGIRSEGPLGTLMGLLLAIIVGCVPVILLFRTMQHFHWDDQAPATDEEPLPEGWEANEWDLPDGGNQTAATT